MIDQMILMTNNGRMNALSVAMKMVEKYRELHPGKTLPVLVQRSGYKDRPLLETLYNRTHGESPEPLIDDMKEDIQKMARHYE